LETTRRAASGSLQASTPPGLGGNRGPSSWPPVVSSQSESSQSVSGPSNALSTMRLYRNSSMEIDSPIIAGPWGVCTFTVEAMPTMGQHGLNLCRRGGGAGAARSNGRRCQGRLRPSSTRARSLWGRRAGAARLNGGARVGSGHPARGPGLCAGEERAPHARTAVPGSAPAIQHAGPVSVQEKSRRRTLERRCQGRLRPSSTRALDWGAGGGLSYVKGIRTHLSFHSWGAGGGLSVKKTPVATACGTTVWRSEKGGGHKTDRRCAKSA
jgi:hypothetical protein